MVRNLQPIWIKFLYVSFCYIIKGKHFCIVLLNCYVQFFLSYILDCFLLVLCAYVSTDLIHCILLSSFELKSILLALSAKILCLSLLNLCCVFNTSLLCFMNSLILSTSILFFSKWFISFLV